MHTWNSIDLTQNCFIPALPEKDQNNAKAILLRLDSILRIFSNLNGSMILNKSSNTALNTPPPLWGGNFKQQLSCVHHQADMNQDAKILPDLQPIISTKSSKSIWEEKEKLWSHMAQADST